MAIASSPSDYTSIDVTIQRVDIIQTKTSRAPCLPFHLLHIPVKHKLQDN